MKPLGLRYQKIDMCTNFYMLYYYEDANITESITYWHARYKLNTSRGKTLVTYKKLRCFLITPWLQKLINVLKDC
jgi:hypothetical protein